jgi:hypothetical protein
MYLVPSPTFAVVGHRKRSTSSSATPRAISGARFAASNPRLKALVIAARAGRMLLRGGFRMRR